jgi:hypothetical protein
MAQLVPGLQAGYFGFHLDRPDSYPVDQYLDIANGLKKNHQF